MTAHGAGEHEQGAARAGRGTQELAASYWCAYDARYRPSVGFTTSPGRFTSGCDVPGDELLEQVAGTARTTCDWPRRSWHSIMLMGRPLDEALLEFAVGAAEARVAIEGLARGYDTVLAREFKEGAELSGGQWQRIAAARAFYRTAPLRFALCRKGRHP